MSVLCSKVIVQIGTTEFLEFIAKNPPLVGEGGRFIKREFYSFPQSNDSYNHDEWIEWEMWVGDQSGRLYEGNYKGWLLNGNGEPPAKFLPRVIAVADNDCCSQFEMLCESENYPGWICKPLEPMSNTVVKIHQKLR